MKAGGPMTHKVYILEGLGCANCASKIEAAIAELQGVEQATIDFVNKKLNITFSEGVDIQSLVDKCSVLANRIESGIRFKEDNGSHHSHDHEHEDSFSALKIFRLSLAFVLFAIGLVFSFTEKVEFVIFLASYILVGGDVLYRAFRNIIKGEIFDENFLMSIATIGAFVIGEYAEGVAVMIFYQVGELFQDMAVDRSRKSIRSLMNIRPDYANVYQNDQWVRVSPDTISVGTLVLVKPGEKIPLDGTIVEGTSSLDTSPLTGESLPRSVEKGDTVLSGSININGLITIRVDKTFTESTVSKILNLVENASSKKAPTEQFITKFARYYTPIVVFAAIALAVFPPLLIKDASFFDWLSRALNFLVVSCPCALVISIPLGFFGGIGGASKNGILIKGGNYLEILNDVDMVVFDKTGTLTKGAFNVTKCVATSVSEDTLLEYAAHAEYYSTHPIASSILRAYDKTVKPEDIQNFEEVAGHGTQVTYKGQKILAGNAKHMTKNGIAIDSIQEIGTVIYIAVNGKLSGYLVISDTVKSDSKSTIEALKKMGISTAMLTGDSKEVADYFAKELGLDTVYAQLLPQQKVEHLEILSQKTKGKLLFVGDGINDAPVLARADVGVAMGALGSDAAIEAADIVLMTDEPSKLITAIKIAKKTKHIVWQNIYFTMFVKIIVLILSAGAIATMWEAVFADVGVALIAIINAMRILRFKN